MQRIYGVRGGAGTQVTEREGQGPIRPGALGVTGFFGVCERGNPGEAVRITGPKHVARMVGDRVDGSLVRDGADDFWRYSKGSGTLYVARVTDGAEVAAEVTLYGRTTVTAQNLASGDRPAHAGAIVKALKITAKDGGRWAGRRRVRSIEDLTIAGAVTKTTIDTGVPMLGNEYAGATMLLIGDHDTSGARRYEVISNTEAGVVTIKSGYDMASDVAEGTAQATVGVLIDLATATSGVSRRKGVSVLVKDGGLNPATEFGLEVYLDEELVCRWADLSMDPTSPRFVEQIVNNDLTNLEIVAQSLLPSFVTTTDLNRPANFVGTVLTTTSSTLKISPFKVARNDSPAKIVLASAEYTDTLLTGGAVAPVRTRMVFTWATGKFTVAVDSVDAPGVAIALADFTVSVPATAAVYDPGVPWLPTVTVDVAATPPNGDVFELLIDPLSASLRGGRLYPDVDNAQFTALRIRSSTYDTITVEAGDPSSIATAVMPAKLTSADGPWVITGGSNDAITVSVDGRKSVIVTLTAGGAVTAAAAAGEINTAFTSAFGAGVLAPASAVDGKLVLTSPGGFDGGGAGSSIELVTVASSAYITLGFAAGITRGADGARCRIEYLQELVNGFDGGTPDLQDYLDALSTVESPMDVAVGDASGNVIIATPGLSKILNASDLAILYKQAVSYCESKPFVFFAETPDSMNETAIINFYANQVGRSDMLAPYAPAMGYVVDPAASGRRKEVSLIPMIAGLWADTATANSGYHKPAAGTDARLYTVLALPDAQKDLDRELLYPVGINPLKRSRDGWYVWGARTLASDTRWTQLSSRLQANHYVWFFINGFDWVIFRLNDKYTWGEIKNVARQYFLKEWANRVLTGDREDDAFTLKIDSDNNTQSSMDQGDLNLDATFRFSKFVERFRIGISTAGVSEAA